MISDCHREAARRQWHWGDPRESEQMWLRAKRRYFYRILASAAVLPALGLAAPGVAQDASQPHAARINAAAACQQAESLLNARRANDAAGLLEPLETTLDAECSSLLIRAYRTSGQHAAAIAAAQRAVQRWPESAQLRLELLEAMLGQGQYALALERIQEATRRFGWTSSLHFCAAAAHFGQGRLLGEVQVRRVPDGRVGQFSGPWLLVEARERPGRFLCCPEDSALFQLRRALDTGFDEPRAHLMHARIWQQLGRPDVALTILRAREDALLSDPQPEVIATFADLALATDRLDDFLRYARRHAEAEPARRSEILQAAYLAVANRCNQRGAMALSRAFLHRAVALKPIQPDLTLRLGDALWDAGARDEARTWYRRVLAERPDHPQRRRMLERIAQE